MAAFVLGVLVSAPVTAFVAAPRATDLVAVDEHRGVVDRVSADGTAFVLDGAGSYHLFTTEGRAFLATGSRVVVGVVHVAGFEDVPLYIRSAG